MTTALEGPPNAWSDRARPLEQRLEDLLERLTLEEKVALMAGSGAFTLEGVERLGIPRLDVTDGPTGVRSQEGEPATVFPTGVALASTWNPALVKEVAAAIGREARALDKAVVLAPTINIARTPLWGRSFETFSEDPFLTAQLGAAYVAGLQGEGVGASLKHYAMNNQEIGRMSVSVEADERTLREIYLSAFEAVVKRARPWTVMSSYNRIGGAYASANPRLLTTILKAEWGFDGVVVSDWGGVHETLGAARAGNDLEMPGPALWYGEKLLAAVREGQVPQASIDESARRLLRLILHCLDAAPGRAGELRSPRHQAIAARAAEQGVVVLRNEAALLPLSAGSLRRLAVVGPNATARRIQGGGSSQVRAAREVSILQAIAALIGDRVELVHADGGDNEPVPPAARAAAFSPDATRSVQGLTCEYFAARAFDDAPFAVRVERRISRLVAMRGAGPQSLGAIRMSGWLWPDRSGAHELSLRGPGEGRIVFDGAVLIDAATPGEPDPMDIFGHALPRRSVAVELEAGRGYPIAIDYVRPADLAAFPYELLQVGLRAPRGTVAEAAELAAGCEAAIVVVGASSVSEAEGYDRDRYGLPGDQDALVEAVVAANPNTVVVLVTGAPYALPWAEHVPAIVQGWFAGEEGPAALARVLFGEAEPSGRLPVSWPRRLEDASAHGWYPGDGTSLRYGEGLFVGYRHFDRAPNPPLFPFGFGLSYTRFAFSDLEASETATLGQSIDVGFTLTNTGERPGAQVAQLYVRPRGPSVQRPVKELKAFARLELAPQQSARVTLTLDQDAFAFWDEASGAWRVEPGAYDLLIGCSAADVELQATVRIE
ncbi:MAG TPA: glycoside hydrolase family 3 C-terminal domain-containing protein [Caulobacteraceae bacterium]|jgi:beta-glucosidase|nr:glycoside hydrolase family 3 C-terminal domain-containing protein [Caulobacteraceae bacterium]